MIMTLRARCAGIPPMPQGPLSVRKFHVRHGAYFTITKTY
jgi:hypothetical protein